MVLFSSSSQPALLQRTALPGASCWQDGLELAKDHQIVGDTIGYKRKDFTKSRTTGKAYSSWMPNASWKCCSGSGSGSGGNISNDGGGRILCHHLASFEVHQGPWAAAVSGSMLGLEEEVSSLCWKFEELTQLLHNYSERSRLEQDLLEELQLELQNERSARQQWQALSEERLVQLASQQKRTLRKEKEWLHRLDSVEDLAADVARRIGPAATSTFSPFLGDHDEPASRPRSGSGSQAAASLPGSIGPAARSAEAQAMALLPAGHPDAKDLVEAQLRVLRKELHSQQLSNLEKSEAAPSTSPATASRLPRHSQQHLDKGRRSAQSLLVSSESTSSSASSPGPGPGGPASAFAPSASASASASCLPVVLRDLHPWDDNVKRKATKGAEMASAAAGDVDEVALSHCLGYLTARLDEQEVSVARLVDGGVEIAERLTRIETCLQEWTSERPGLPFIPLRTKDPPVGVVSVRAIDKK